MNKYVIANFTWQMPDQLATGGKPSSIEQLKWLIDKGLGAILSLEVIPEEVELQISKLNIPHLVIEMPEEEEIREQSRKWAKDEKQFVCYLGNITDMPVDDWKKMTMFINTNIEMGKVVFVHCSAGIKRSPRVAERYLYQQIRLTGWWLPSIGLYDQCINNYFKLACKVLDQTFAFNADGSFRKLESEEIPTSYDNDESHGVLNYCERKNCRILRCVDPGNHQFQIGVERWRSTRSVCVRNGHYGEGVGVFEVRNDWKLKDVVGNIYWQSKKLNGKGLLHGSMHIGEDNYNWLFAHQTLYGNRTREAIGILISALGEDSRLDNSRELAADSLAEFFLHRTCGCFDQESLRAMDQAYIRLEQVLSDLLAGKYTLPSDDMKTLVQRYVNDSILAIRQAITAYRPS